MKTKKNRGKKLCCSFFAKK